MTTDERSGSSAHPSGQHAPAPPPPPPGQSTPPSFVYVERSRTNGLAVAAMVLGILWIWWIGSVLAVIFGHVSLSHIKRSNGAERGRGMAIAGLVLGYIGVATLILVIALFVFAGSNTDDAGAAACEADAASVATAEEAYFAMNGRYVPEQDLVPDFLRHESDLHDVSVSGTDYVITAVGSCA